MEERRIALRAVRKTKVQPSQRDRPKRVCVCEVGEVRP